MRGRLAVSELRFTDNAIELRLSGMAAVLMLVASGASALPAADRVRNNGGSRSGTATELWLRAERCDGGGYLAVVRARWLRTQCAIAEALAVSRAELAVNATTTTV
jgi:hypothetical protein